MVVIYSSVQGDTYFVAITQAVPERKQHPIELVAGFLTRIELKYGTLTTLVRKGSLGS